MKRSGPRDVNHKNPIIYCLYLAKGFSWFHNPSGFMKKFAGFFLLLFTLSVAAQKRQIISLAFTDNANAFPFGKFAGFFNNPVHAGFELGWAHVKEKKKHDWFWELRTGYFYHQFVQHGIPLYAIGGYRYRIIQHLSTDASLGAG